MQIRPDVVGPRLKAARTSARLTQEEAANALGLARTTLLAIEAGKRPAKIDEIRAFANLYGVREGELLSESRQPLDLDVRFRASGGSSLAEGEQPKDAASALLTRLAAASLDLEEMLGQRVVPVDFPVWHLSNDQSIDDQAEDAALMVRQRLGLGLGPLPDLKPLLELEFAARVFERPLAPTISGACAYDRDHGAFILLNSNHWPERRQQTSGHEIAHGMVRPGQPAVVVNTDKFEQREDKFCDAFARAFLMPAVTVRRKANELRGVDKLTVRHVLWLAAYFRVSI